MLYIRMDNINRTIRLSIFVFLGTAVQTRRVWITFRYAMTIQSVSMGFQDT